MNFSTEHREKHSCDEVNITKLATYREKKKEICIQKYETERAKTNQSTRKCYNFAPYLQLCQ